MPDHFDALETRGPALREREQCARLAGVIANALAAPGWARQLAGVDPKTITCRTALAKLPVLRANPDVRIRVEGNADERGSDEYNLALGMRRAQLARKYLVDHGIDAGRIDISSNGEEKPVCKDHNESCWSQNRRDEFVIVAGSITKP